MGKRRAVWLCHGKGRRFGEPRIGLPPAPSKKGQGVHGFLRTDYGSLGHGQRDEQLCWALLECQLLVGRGGEK
jgi:hypothetical protein